MRVPKGELIPKSSEACWEVNLSGNSDARIANAMAPTIILNLLAFDATPGRPVHYPVDTYRSEIQ